MMYGWGGNAWGMGGWIIMAIIMVLFWGAVVAGVVYLFRRGRPREEHVESRMPHEDAARILSERFARGEIDETEYRARQAVLRAQ